jgi:hypothetical protein
MKNILKYIHTILMIAAVGYLRYYVLILTPYAQSALIVAGGMTLFMCLLLWFKYSDMGKKKWWIIAFGVLGIIASELIFMQVVSLGNVNDIVKLWLVITIFMSLFGVFSEKKEFIKGEYSKKAQIIEI